MLWQIYIEIGHNAIVVSLPKCTNKDITNLHILFLKYLSWTSYNCSYRICNDMLAFLNMKTCYGQFTLKSEIML